MDFENLLRVLRGELEPAVETLLSLNLASFTAPQEKSVLGERLYLMQRLKVAMSHTKDAVRQERLKNSLKKVQKIKPLRKPS